MSLYLTLFSLIVDMMVVDDIFNMFQILANAKLMASIYAFYIGVTYTKCIMF